MLRRSLIIVCAFMLASCSIVGRRTQPSSDDAHDHQGFIILNGERTEVHWSDGDSFTFASGVHTGKGTRLQGYNTLEAYGPVHRWGSWSREDLFTIAKQSSVVAASRVWECTTDDSEDAYHRVLVDCPALSFEMVMKGYGLAYAVNGRPPVRVLDAMHQAQRAKRGIWKHGVVHGVITSLHSFGEDAKSSYGASANRVLDTRTGEALLRKHTDRYESCQEVCLTTDGDVSCMVYVPFNKRYKDQPPCLKGD